MLIDRPYFNCPFFAANFAQSLKDFVGSFSPIPLPACWRAPYFSQPEPYFVAAS